MDSIRDLRPEELETVYRRVARDFPPIEYPPLRKMAGHLADGVIAARLYEHDGRDAAYAFLLRAPGVKRAMLFLYAVEPEMRGQGVGSAFLRSLLGECGSYDGLYAEVEKAKLALDAHEREIRLKRIAFYENLGFVRLEGLRYWTYGVEMHLYCRPLRGASVPNVEQAMDDARELYAGIIQDRWQNLRMRAER